MQMLKPSLSLLLIAGVCGSLLALTQSLTAPRIETNTRNYDLRMIKELTGTIPRGSGTWSGNLWNLCNGTQLVRTETTGYGGPMTLLIALASDHEQLKLRGIRITRHAETPGLADFLRQPDRGWLALIKGLNQFEFTEVDTVAGATITSKAIQRGVLSAFFLLQERMQERMQERVQGRVLNPEECRP
jgi:Na+-translocating ferredoxin:NAD+ oxidoreductase RnfG subunit